MSAENAIVALNDEFRVSEMENLNEPVVGMTFCSPDEAYQFYKKYSCKVGFGITRRTSHNFYGIKYDITLCCNKNRPPISSKDEEGYRARVRGVVGTGCRARIVVKDRMLNGNWCIEEVELEHNHDLRPDCVRLMRCHRELPLFVKKQLQVNECVGLAQNKSICSIFTQAGGVTQCMFTDRDMRNYVSELRRLKLKGGDAAALMQYFRKQQSLCPNFWYTYDLDEDGRLKNIFWADGRSRAAFKYFGDVVTFDSTYLTNRYRMPFAVFVGVNHHGQSILLGCALLTNEFKETYQWVFQSFIDCMNGAPKGIITDQCGSICGAVQEVFRETRHRLCLWHIMKKLPEKLISNDRRHEVMSAVNKAVYDSRSVQEFDYLWVKLMTDFELGSSSSWFQDLFNIRFLWVPVFVKPYFWAGMSTTQRSESMNAFFDGYVNSRTSLRNFVEKYDVALHSKWEKEKQEDFRCLNQRPRLVSSLGFEKQFAEVYTLKMFYIFQKEVKQLMSCKSELLSVSDDVKVFRVIEFPGNDNYIVHFNLCSQDFYCQCMMFQFRGIVCRHGLCVYRDEGVDVIPTKYVISRWRCDFIRSHLNEIVSMPTVHHDIGRYDMLYSKVNLVVLDMVEIASRDDSLVEKLISELSKVRITLSNCYGAIQNSGCIDVDSENNDCGLVEKYPEDPVLIQSKGRPKNGRLKPDGEKFSKRHKKGGSVGKKKKRVSSCKKVGSSKSDNVLKDCDIDVDSMLSASELLLHFQSNSMKH